MLQRTLPWVVGGVSVGLIISMSLWLMFSLYLRPFTLSGRPSGFDQSAVTSIIEASVNNPEVQIIIKTQVINYLKTPEGRTQMAEALKSPELVKALSQSLKSPELQAAILQLMKEPDFRREVIEIVKDTPEMKLLTTISSAIVFENPAAANAPAKSRPYDPYDSYY